MEYDANIKRGMFIDKSVNIREAFDFADPTSMLQAIQLYAMLEMGIGPYYGTYMVSKPSSIIILGIPV